MEQHHEHELTRKLAHVKGGREEDARSQEGGLYYQYLIYFRSRTKYFAWCTSIQYIESRREPHDQGMLSL